MASNRLSIREKLGFGVCDLGGNLFFTAMGFWSLNYLTDSVGLSAALAGMAVFIGKLWDAITDPMVGFISDRTNTRWGRRRPFILFGAIPLFLSMWFFFTNPGLTSPILLFIWATVALMLLNTAYTLVNIPYSSLTPELTDDYHERTSLNGFRFAFAVIGTILGAAAVLPIVNAFPDRNSGYSGAGAILGLIMAITALITFFGVREKGHATREYPKEKFFSTYFAVFTNKPYLIVLATYALNLTGLNFLQGILVYYTKYIYQNEGLTTPAMVLLLITAMICIPISVLVSKKIGKKRTYQICFAVLGSACLAIFSLGHILGESFFLFMMVYAGIGIGFGYVAPWAMVPDTIEYDAVHSGKRKEGAYYGMWTLFSKAGQALSIFISGLILSAGGYVAETVQSESSLMAIRLLIGPLPVVLFIGAIILINKYPLDERTYNEMMAKAGKK